MKHEALCRGQFFWRGKCRVISKLVLQTVRLWTEKRACRVGTISLREDFCRNMAKKY